MSYKDVYKKGILIYTSQEDDIGFRTWGLKQTTCNIQFYTIEPLDEIDNIICSIIIDNEGKIDGDKLATILGFNVKDNFLSSTKRYKDVGEIDFFMAITKQVEDWGLIKKSKKKECLPTYIITELGKRAIERNEKYVFYKAQKTLLENQFQGIKDESLYFPFYEALGWSTNNCFVTKLGYDTIDIEIFDKEKTELIEQLNLQTSSESHIYFAEETRYFNFTSRLVDIRLYQYQDIFYPIVFYNNEISLDATELINKNKEYKKNKIEWGRWLNIQKNPSAVLDYSVVREFEDIIDFCALICDKRVKWEDNNLFKLISDKADATLWNVISSNCPFNVVKLHLEEYSIYWNWVTLSMRTDDDFLIKNADHENFYWDFEGISSKPDINPQLIKKLLLIPSLKDRPWNWDNIIPIIGNDFVRDNIDKIDFDLRIKTKQDIEFTQSLLSRYPNKHWDWSFITDKYDLQYLYENINVLGKFVNLTKLIDRIFTTENYCDLFMASESFRLSIKENEEQLKIYTANNKNYKWNFNIINFFEEYELISWASTNNVNGFECNPYLVWDSKLFNMYKNKISTPKGFDYLSSIIEYPQIISENLDFSWNWDILSENEFIVSQDRFVIDNADKFNWHILLSHISGNVIEVFFNNNRLYNFLAKDSNLWAIVTDKVSIDYIQKNLEFPWDWDCLTKRFFSKFKIENMGNERFVDKWNWSFITKNLPIEVIEKYLNKYIDYWDWDYLTSKLNIEFIKEIIPEYNDYWNWEILLSRFSSDDLIINDNALLIEIATCFTTFNKNKQNELWKIITRIFSYNELTSLIYVTSKIDIFRWDFEYFYNLDEFDLISYIDKYNHIIHWDILSCSRKLNKELEWHRKEEGLKVWENRIISLLKVDKYQWDFKYLSKLESINNSIPILKIRTRDWDWQFLSENSFKYNFDNIAEVFNQYLDFNILSSRDDITITQKFIEENIYKWNFYALSSNSQAQVDLSFIVKYKDKDWNWDALSSRRIKFDNENFIRLINKPWNWSAISCRTDLTFNPSLIEKIKEKPLNWFVVSGNKSFVPSKNVLDELYDKSLDWDAISQNALSLETISSYKDVLNWSLLCQNSSLEISDSNLKKFKEYLDWDYVSSNIKFQLSLKHLKEYETTINWSIINSRDDFIITNDILYLFANKIDWVKASNSRDLDFSEELIEQYRDYWDWNILRKNPHALVHLTKYQEEFNYADFIDQFDVTPYIYHFTHLYNAVDIIKSRKILSRNEAEGKFTSSAGGLVDRRVEAHKYARFYFRPQTPTQFYNECLGIDEDSSNMNRKTYYPQALNLGLPKCPMPIFFKFDLAEVLRIMADKCYYSTGNMQTNWATIEKISINPHRLNTTYLYSSYLDYENYKQFSQQEFLVEKEFDFSKLNSFEIICYNEEQANILIERLGDDSICKKISIGSGHKIYHRNNRELHFVEKENEISISSDYRGDAYFSIKGDIDNISILNPKCIIKESKTEIIAYPSVVFTKDTKHIDIHFVDNKAKTKDWIIYRT